ncbi:MAG TPA: glycosyltransferase family 2 protein, partial [Candidatus Acidoferrales bacterium]|nr:glycosyltransferase family 2 protein [Candidatus Acidoferrales bacterium]
MLEAFYILVFLQALLGLYSLWEGLRWLQMARRRLATHAGFYAPRVAVICPCKGAEPGLEQNIAALAAFDYPSYELFFTLASATDPAHNVLRRVTTPSKPAAQALNPSGMQRAHVVIAGRPEGTSEKVNNLRAAVEQLSEDFEVIVFTDSDGRPGRGWLGRLVAPLGDARLGAATTFRWHLPDRGGLWSALGAAWNAAIITVYGEHGRNFCWGGGTAIRRKTFEEIQALEFWRGSASDDYSLTLALRRAGRDILFVPECLVP